MGIIDDPTRTMYELTILHQESVSAFDTYLRSKTTVTQEEKEALLSGLVDLRSQPKQTKETKVDQIFATASSLWTESLIRGLNRERPGSGGLELQTRDDFKSVGSMYLFNYNPLTKEKLSYYDTLPLVLVTGVESKKFIGVNLHIIPPKQRIFLVGKLLKNYNEKIEGSFSGIDFGYLNTRDGNKIVKNCYRSYYDQRISSINMMRIGPEDWMTVARMPLERFRKLSRESVWEQIRRKQ